LLCCKWWWSFASAEVVAVGRMRVGQFVMLFSFQSGQSEDVEVAALKGMPMECGCMRRSCCVSRTHSCSEMVCEKCRGRLDANVDSL
jgi:hypothetical protein